MIKLAGLLILFTPLAMGITLDTGHTFKQYGSVSPQGITEFQYNKSMADNIEQILSVRRLPLDLSLEERSSQPFDDLFVSIHHDSFSDELRPYMDELKGFSIFVSAKNLYPNSSFACAVKVADALIQAGERPSAFHGWNFKGERKTQLHPNGVFRYDNLIVLKNNQSPAILIEVGVIKNAKESQRLAEPTVKKRIALAISKGLKNCVE